MNQTYNQPARAAMQTPSSLTDSFFIHFPYEPPFPKTNTDACLHHTHILTAVFNDPACWYSLMARQEFWDKPALARKPKPFYSLYFGLVIGFLNLWSRGIVSVYKKDRKIIVSAKEPETDLNIGFFEDELLKHCRIKSESLYADLLASFFARYKNVRQFSGQFKGQIIKDYDSLFEVLNTLNWLLEIHKIEGESEYIEDSLAIETNPVCVTVQLMNETEAFVLKQKWSWWG
jgi:hypothetical protein